jgi:hypothetical protein
MFDHPCKDCNALFGEMHSAIDDAKAIVEEAAALIHATKPSDHIDEWWQTRDRWQTARQRWLEASRHLQNHLATHQSSPHLSQEHGPGPGADKISPSQPARICSPQIAVS